MKNPSLKVLLITLFIATGLTFAYQSQAVRANYQATTSDKKPKSLSQEKFGKLPLSFAANKGQADPKVKFLARGNGYGILLNNNSANFRLRSNKEETTYSDVTMKFLKSNATVKLSAENQIDGVSNYFLGNNKQHWQTKVPNFERVRYENIYRGIDLLYYGNQRQIEYDFVVAPHANPAQIALNFGGITASKIEPNGDLILTTPQGELRQLKPQAYQEINGTRQTVEAEYTVDNKQNVKFRLGGYDKNFALVIDPVILNSTYLGGTGSDIARAIAVGKDGGIYIFGDTTSTDFLAASPIQAVKNTGTDTYLMKLNPAGTQLVWSTWLGGTAEDLSRAIYVDDEGNSYLTGVTLSTNFPVSDSAFKKTKSEGSDTFLTKVNPTGTALIYSTLLGGNSTDSTTDITADAMGNAFVVGSTSSSDLPATGFQTTRKGNSIYRSSNKAASWTAAGAGIPSAQFTSITFDPVTPATVYATTTGGLYKSINGGTNWQVIPSLPYTVYAAAIDPKVPANIFAATSFGIHKSTDGGLTWQRTVNGILSPLPNLTIAVSPQNPQIIYAGGSREIYKSTDGGQNWVTSSNGLATSLFGQNQPIINKILVDNANPQLLYAATGFGFFKSVDAGANWTKAQNGLPLQGSDPNVSNAFPDPSTPNTLYALLANNQGLYKTTNGGTSWGLVIQGIPIDVAGQSVTFQLGTAAVDPTSPTTLYATTTSNLGIFKSTDSGKNWTQQNTGLTNLTVSAIGFSASGEILLGTNSGADVFVAKFNPTGSALNYLTYISGDENDGASGIAVDKDGNAIICGTTNSQNFPVVTPMQPTLGGLTDAFVTKLNATGTALIWSTYLGGRSSDVSTDLALGKSGSLYIGGYTNSTNFPTTANADFQNTRGGTDGFVSKLKSDGSALEFSTYYGGSNTDQLISIAVDASENIYATGTTVSTDFPLIDPTLPLNPIQFSSNEIFVIKLSPAKTASPYSTTIGGNSFDLPYGIAVDSLNQAYVVGYTGSQTFPLVNPFQAQNKGSNEGVFIRLGIEADVSVSQTQARNPVMINNEQTYTVTVTNNGPSPATAVKLKDILPTGLSFVSATPAKGSCINTAGTISCDLGDMTLNEKINAVIKVKPTTAGKINHTVSVTSSDPDSTPANNSSTLETTISTLPSIIGRVTDSTGAGVQGVKISVTGGATTTATTDVDGNYQLNELALNGNYSLTATKTNYSFEPPFTAFTNLIADQTANFTGTVCAYTLYPTSQDFMLAGGGNTISVLGTARCPWTATVSTESASWLKITSGAIGIGNGTITYTVAPSTITRRGYISVAGQNFAVFQRGDSICDTPTFRQREYSTEGQVTSTFVAEMNGDKNLDLIVVEAGYFQQTNTYDRTLKILFGDGTGNFSPGSKLQLDYANSTGFSLIAGKDFNKDNKNDILLTDHSSHSVVLYLNDGTGKFSRTSVNINMDPSYGILQLQAFDLNNDGYLDLMVGGASNIDSSSGIKIALSKNGTSFDEPYFIKLNTSNLYAVSDVTGDGIVDLITTGNNGTSSEISVYPGDGIGSFSAPINSNFVASGQISNSQSVATGDFNSDGYLDIAMSVFRIDTSYVPAIALIPGQANGKFGIATYTPIEGNINRLISGDFNGDARQDLIAIIGIQGMFLSGDGAGKFPTKTTIPSPINTYSSNSSVVADINQDGKDDIVEPRQFSTNYNLYNVTVLLNRCGSTASPSIFGTIKLNNNSRVIPNLTVKLSGAKSATTKTDSFGNYEFAGLPTGTDYEIRPETSGYQFAPAVAGVVSLTNEQKVDFEATKIIVAVPSASYKVGEIARGSLVSIFGIDMTDIAAAATSLPLPTELAGLNVNVGGIQAKLLYVSPGQINLQIPEELPIGASEIIVASPRPYLQFLQTRIIVTNTSPGLFTANSDGAGPPAATVIYVNGTTQLFDQAAICLPGQVCKPKPIDLLAGDVYLELYGTGIRNKGLSIKAEIAGVDAPVTYSGAHCCFAGLDQVNVRIPKLLVARGEVDLRLIVDGTPTNSAKISLK